MTQRTRVALAVGVAALVGAGSLSAHHSFGGEFDAQKVLTVKGVVTRFELINPHSFIYVDAKGENGQVQRWALEGPGLLQLKRMGIDAATIKSGDTVEACGYGTRDGVDLPKVDQSASGRRILSAEQLTLPDGQKRVWSNYGQGKCLPPSDPVR